MGEKGLKNNKVAIRNKSELCMDIILKNFNLTMGNTKKNVEVATKRYEEFNKTNKADSSLIIGLKDLVDLVSKQFREIHNIDIARNTVIISLDYLLSDVDSCIRKSKSNDLPLELRAQIGKENKTSHSFVYLINPNTFLGDSHKVSSVIGDIYEYSNKLKDEVIDLPNNLLDNNECQFLDILKEEEIEELFSIRDEVIRLNTRIAKLLISRKKEDLLNREI